MFECQAIQIGKAPSIFGSVQVHLAPTHHRDRLIGMHETKQASSNNTRPVRALSIRMALHLRGLEADKWMTKISKFYIHYIIYSLAVVPYTTELFLMSLE